jgi:hypothetical protein
LQKSPFLDFFDSFSKYHHRLFLRLLLTKSHPSGYKHILNIPDFLIPADLKRYHTPVIKSGFSPDFCAPSNNQQT